MSSFRSPRLFFVDLGCPGFADPLRKLGTVTEIIKLFGGKPAYLAAVRQLETALYQRAA